MAKYPAWGVGTDVSATNLALGIPNIVTKAAAETANNDSTLSNDAELVNISLGIGTHWVKLYFLWTCDTSATPDIKTRWVFTTGTWNNPLRICKGPASTNTAAPDAVTPMKLSVVAAGTDIAYGTAAGTTYYCAEEESFTVVVTVAGTLSLQWAQNTANASDTKVREGTTFITRQIAA